MNKNKTSRSWYGFTSVRLCHYFTNITLNLANHANCVPETMSSIGWGLLQSQLSHMYPSAEQNKWCDLWG